MTQSHSSYEIFEEIGRGEGTVVFRAHDLNLRRDVAIKQLAEPAQADTRRSEQFLQEAQFLAQFEHAGILRIHSVETQQGWIVMELMKGTLATQIDHAPLDAETVRSILHQLLPALEFLHSRDRIHGAIRPSNILIDDSGTVKLSDFEASNLRGELRAPVGTKKYLAPELIRPEFGSPGPQTDLYCLGFTALELLAGPKLESKFPHASAAAIDEEVTWLRWHSSQESFPPAAKLIPKLAPDLAELLDWMLKKEVAQRCDSAQAAIKKLTEQDIVPVSVVERAVESETASQGREQSKMLPTAVREIEPPTHVRSPAMRTDSRTSPPVKRQLASSGGSKREQWNQILGKPWVLYPLCVVMLLGALAVGLALRDSDEPVELAKLPPASSESESSQDREPEQPEPGEVQPEKVTSPQSVPTRSDELGGLPAEVPQDVGRASEPELDASQAEVADDGDAAKSVSEEQPLDQAEALVQKEPLEIPESRTEDEDLDDVPGEIPRPEDVFSQQEPERDPPARQEEPPAKRELNNPLGPMLELVSTENQIDTSELEREFKGEAELVIDAAGFISEVLDLAISPDGRWLAAAGKKEVRIWDLSSGRLVDTLRGDRARTSYGDCYAVEFSQDNQYLLVGVNDYQAHGSIRVYRCDALEEIETLLAGHNAPVRKLDFSRDGRWMVSADADGHVAIWDWSERRIIKKIPPRDPQQPIYDELHFAGDEPVLSGIDFGGPVLMSVPELRRLTGQDVLPPKLHAWIIDVLARKLSYPFETSEDPRTMDLRLEHNLWAAAGVSRKPKGNKFWAAVWPAHSLQEPTVAEPLVVYSGHKWNISTIDLAPEHELVASADKFGEIHVWNLKTGDRLHRFAGQGKPIYEAAFDRGSKRIVFGTKAHTPREWSRNNYGRIDQILDLEKRAIYAAEDASGLEPVQELPGNDRVRFEVRSEPDSANVSIEKMVQGKAVSRYQFTTGRIPTIYSLLERPELGVRQPVLLGDNLGLLGLWDSDKDELKRAFIGHDNMVSSVSRSPNGNMILSSSTDRTLRIWSLDDYRPTGIFDFKFENSAVTRVLPGTSSHRAGVRVGDRIVTLAGNSMDQTYRLMLAGKFDYRPGQTIPVQMQRGDEVYSFEMVLSEGYDFVDPILSVFIGDDGQWIIWTPMGYYDASPGAEQLIGWHVNRGPDKSAKFYRVQQFRKQLYRPDIINRILSGESIQEAIVAANRRKGQTDSVDFRSPSDIANHHPPKIEFLSPWRGERLSANQVVVEASLESRNGLPIREATLIVNGVAEQVFVAETPHQQSLDISYTVQLESGRNDIELIAANAESTSAAKSVYVVVEATVPHVAANLNVLAIGISEYAETQGDFVNLPQAADDAHTFASTVARQGNSQLYAEVRSRVLTDSRATRTEILDGLQWLVDQTEPNDTVAIFMAAHGFVDSSENFYLGTYEVDKTRPRATAVSWREFTKTLHEDLPSGKRLVFLDIRPTREAIAPGIRNPLLDLAAPEMATIFFSSNSMQQFEMPSLSGRNGYSTAALTRAMSDAAADVEPSPPDSMLNAREMSTVWTESIRDLSQDQLYPVAFSPESSKRVNVLQIRKTN